MFLSLLLAHVVADFYLQTDKTCAAKERYKLKSRFLYLHALLVGLTAWILVPEAAFLLCFLALTLTHWSIDAVKVYCPQGLWGFLADQLAHVAVLLVLTFMYQPQRLLPIQYLDCSSAFSVPLFLLAALLAVKPANILIKLILKKYRVGEAQSCADIRSAGALIGNLERVLTIIFVMIGQYEAIGFIIAAKSILRFKDTDTAKTEYVLAGTFLSFGIALLCGLLAAM